MEPPHQHHQACLDWRRVAPLLASDAAAAGKAGSGKKLRIRVLDTVFLSDGRSSAGNGAARGSSYSRRQPLNRRAQPYGSSSSYQQQATIGEWIYTSKKGEVTMRRGHSSGGPPTSSSSSSPWSHVCDRFGRIALSDAANAAGPRIVAIGRGRGRGRGRGVDGDGDGGGGFDVRCHLTAEQLRRGVCGSSACASGAGGGGGGGSLISANRCHSIQSYVRPKGGVDRIFRAIYTSDVSGSNTKKPTTNVDVVMVEDSSTVGTSCASVVPLDESTLGKQQGGEQYFRQVKKEVLMTTTHVVMHVESVLNALHSDRNERRAREEVKEKAPRIVSVAMDFIWDDNGHLWLSHSDGMRISRGEEDQDQDDDRSVVDGGDGTDNNGTSSSSLGPLLENYSEHTPIVDGGGDVAAGGGPPLLQRSVPMASSSVAEMEFIERNGLDPMSKSQNDVQHTKELLALAEQDKHEAQEEARHLQQQVDELEYELEGMKSRLDASSQMALDANDKIQSLNLKLAKLRKQMVSELQTKDDEHCRIVLELESQINAEKAEVARLQAEAAATASTPTAAPNGNTNAAAEFLQQDLLAKIDSLHNELIAAKRNWGQERRSLASSHAAAEQERAAKHRKELAEQRAAISSLEDNVVAQTEKTRDAEKESIVLLQKLATANHRADEAQIEATNLRDELVLVKQSFENFRESSGSGGSTHNTSNTLLLSNTNPSSTSSSANEESENKIRTLNNKVEYLKAQLQSEVTVKEEYKSTVSSLRKEKEVLVNAHRCRLNELEARKEQQILQVQEQLRVALKRPSEDDIAQLQEEIKALKTQLEEAKQISAEVRQCEQDARADAKREQSLAERARQELEAARNETAAAIREIDKLKDANLDATANEGVLRRLDNERRYLKNQLHLEIASKAELLKKVEESDHRIKMVQDASRQEQRALSLELKKEKHSHTVVESQLRDSNQILDAEVKVQKNQIEELRQAYAATRDQLRMEQASAEQIRASGQRMAEELKAAQDELKYLSIVADDDATRHNETTRAISDSLKKADDLRAQEVCRLQEETQQALQKASDTQRDMLTLRAKMRSQQMQAAKTFAAHHLTVLLAQQLRTKKQQAFSSWHLQAAVIQAQRFVSSKSSSSTDEAVARARAECIEEWQLRLEIVQKETELQVKGLEDRILKERSRILDEARAEQDETIREERHRHEAIMREKEMSWTQKEKDIHSSHQSAIAKLIRENNQNLESVQTNAQRRIDEAKSDAIVDIEERKQIIVQECNRQWESKVADLHSAHEREMQDAIAHNTQQHSRNLQQEQAKFAAREAELKVEMETAIELAVAKETERMDDIKSKAIEENNAAWNDKIKESQASHISDRDALQVRHQDELSNTIAALEYSRQERERDLRADIERRHSAALEEVHNTEHQRIDKAVAGETEIWEQRMRELQTKMEVECRQQFEKGHAEGCATAKEGIDEAHANAQEILAKERNDSEARVQRALDSKAIEVERALLEAKSKQNEAVAKALEEANAEHQRQMKEAEQDCEAALEQEQKRLSLLAEKETERALAAAKEEHDAITKGLRTNLEASETLRSKEKESFASQLEQVKASAEKSMEKRLAALERQTRERHALEREKAQREFDQQRLLLNKIHKKEVEKVKTEAAERSNIAILKVQEDAKEAMKNALDKLVTTHEEQEIELRAEAKSMMDERDSALQDIALLQSEIANQQSAIEEANEHLASAQKSSALRILRLASSSIIRQNALNETLESTQGEFNTRFQVIQDEATATQENLEQRISDMESTIKSYQAQRKLAQDVLISQNRDALLREKAKSREVLSQLDTIGAERQTLQDERQSAKGQRDALENQIRELEGKIQQHSQTSSLQGGRINIAHARKKRALDEAYDILLDKLESNREEISSIDERLKEVLDRKEVQEERRKATERALVEILLGQTKKVMQILNNNLT